MEIGVLLDADSAGTDELVTLARAAEDKGIGIALVTGSRNADAWAMATWIAGVTDRIRVGVPPREQGYEPTNPDSAVPSVLDKAATALAALAPERTPPPGTRFRIVAADADDGAIRDAAGAGIPVVPVRSAADMTRLAALVAAPEPEAPAGRPHRSGPALAQRVPGIGYDAVPASLAGRAIEPGDREHRAVSSTYLRGGNPGLVLRPRTVAEVVDAIAFARDHRDIPLGIRSAGHGISGRSTNRDGLVISVGAMNSLEVLDASRRLVRIEPGRTWKQVAHSLVSHGWALGSGDYGGVGVGGLATAGGIGLISRRHGLTVDHVKAVELVLADGTPVRTSDTENPDLFWAVRGAGANFGIATAFEFETSVVGEVGYAKLTLVSSDIEASLYRYGQIASQAPRDTTVFLVTGRARRGQWVISLYAVVDNPDPDIVVARLTPFLELGQLVRQHALMTGYPGVMDNAVDIGPSGQQGFGEPVSRSAFVPTLTRQFAREAAELLSTDLVYFFELRAMGGAISDVPSDAMAFSHRTPHFQLTAMSSSDDRLMAEWDKLRPHFDGLYLSFETDRHPERLLDAFPAPVLERLRRLKAEYDPTNLFRDNFNIAPAPLASETRVAA
ncbi:LLM class flavin-dependent oxidoreductase [Plantactinospora sp. WMMB334]|uniref:FAD-binding oxidoreductase n=1 Tax=Plantactinospora sp. WMMB334 TaxID=3404119 RepID=UPI003B954B11